MFPLVAALLLLPLLLGGQSGPATTQKILSRISEEADLFQQKLPLTVTQETLEQRAVMPPSRFKPRIGAAATVVSKPRLVSHEVISEYTVGPLKNSDSSNLVEFRQVISVDSRVIQSPDSARHALSLGVRTQDDRLRKRMLEDFAKTGLVDVASDYGLILLAFTRRALDNIQFGQPAENRIGADTALVFPWKQTSSVGGELQFSGRQSVRQALQGTLWVRSADGLPLRVQAWAEYADAKRKIRDEASIDYAMSQHGFLTPVSVVHRHIVDGQLMTENLYRYQPFRLFAADAEIKFTEVPDPPPPPVKK
jgi:hypothetical protein